MFSEERLDIKIEVRIQNLFVINNYVSDIEDLPGIIEMEVYRKRTSREI